MVKESVVTMVMSGALDLLGLLLGSRVPPAWHVRDDVLQSILPDELHLIVASGGVGGGVLEQLTRSFILSHVDLL